MKTHLLQLKGLSMKKLFAIALAGTSLVAGGAWATGPMTTGEVRKVDRKPTKSP